MENSEMQTICVAGLPMLASGVHGTVFLLAKDRILKLYRPEISPQQVAMEARLSEEAFRRGVPTAAVYGTARCGDRFGIVFERICGDTLGHAIAADPKKAVSCAGQYAALVRKLHAIRIQDGFFPDLRAELKRKLSLLEPFCTESDLRLLEDLIACLPKADSLLHGDLHPGNIMVRDGELLIIDLPEMTRGSPLWDAAAIYRDLIIGPMFPTEALEKSIGMPAPLITRTGRAFFAAYTDLAGEALEKYLNSLLPLYGMNTVFTVGATDDRDAESCRQLLPMLMTEAIRKHEDSLRTMLMGNKKGE